MDLYDLTFFRDALALADRLGGTLHLDSQSRLVINLPEDGETADLVAASITGEDFSHTYLIPDSDYVLTFEA